MIHRNLPEGEHSGEAEHVHSEAPSQASACQGRPAIECLGLITWIGTVKKTGQNPVDQFSHLFSGLGKLEGDYTIKLQEGAKPFALSTPRRVPVPLLKPVKEELKRMEKLGVIARVNEPTNWCAGMVPVPKKNGKVRICVDLTRLNESIQRERHPLPAVELSCLVLGYSQNSMRTQDFGRYPWLLNQHYSQPLSLPLGDTVSIWNHLRSQTFPKACFRSSHRH